MNKSEAGHLGGIETSVRFGPVRCPTCGYLPEKSEFHVRNGRHGGSRGGRKVLKIYGRNHFSEIGRLGGRPKEDR